MLSKECNLDALTLIAESFNCTEFRVVKGTYTQLDMIQVLTDEGWDDFAEVLSDDCAEPIVEVLSALPGLIAEIRRLRKEDYT